MAQAVTSPTYESDEPKKEKEGEEDSYKEFTAENDDLSPEEKAKLVDKLDKMFRYALDHTSWINGRAKMIKCFKYSEGEQWTADELKILEDRHQPDTVNNQISVVVNKLVGELVNQRFRVGYRGRVDEIDKDVADLLSDIFLYIRQSNDLEFEERDMAADGFTCGMGALEVYVTFDDMMQPEIKVRHEDPLIVFPDPDSRRYDWNEDANFIARAKWWKLDEACEAYPQAAADLKSMAGGSAISLGDDAGRGQLASVDHFKGEKYVDKDNERVRLIEVQYKKMAREQLLILGTGQSLPFTEKKEVLPVLKQAKEANIPYRIIDRLKPTICIGVYAAGVLLEHKETEHKYFSLVPYFAYRRKTGEPYSLITLALSMQDAINKRESKALHLLTVNQVIAEKSAVDNKEETQAEIAKPDGYVELRDGALSQQRFQVEKNLELAASQFNMHQAAQKDLYAIVGLDPRMGQSTGEIRSGAGLQRKYAEGVKPIATLFDNVRRTRKIFARVALDRVQQYYTPQKTFLITDDEKKSRLVGISADAMQKIKNGQYDAVVDEFEDDATTQDEQFRVFAETLPQILQFPPVYTSMLVKMSRIRNKEEVLKVLEAQNGPPPIQPKMNLQANLDAMQPVERAGVWELVGRADIAQQVRQLNPPTATETKAQADLAKENMKSGGQGEQMKAMGEQQKIMLEMRQSQEEHDLKMAEMQAKLQVMTTKHQLDMEKEAMKAMNMNKAGAEK